MRVQAFLLFSLCVASTHGQTVLDAAFINERFVLNASANLLEKDSIDWTIRKNSQGIRTYAMDEPYYWVKRIYQRIELGANKALTESSTSDSILPIVDIINRSIEAGTLQPYTDMDFGVSFQPADLVHVVPSAIILKVDLAYDYPTKELKTHIIGFYLEQPGGVLVSFYYPELRYALRPYKIHTTEGLADCDTYFDRWLFTSHMVEPENTIQNTRSNWSPLLEQQAEFDALTDLFLVQHEIANHHVLRSGKRTVPLTSYAPEPLFAHVEFDEKGTLKHVEVRRGKSVRMIVSYTAGKPDGPFRAFYPDGSLKEEGQFKVGLREGQWTSWFANRNIRSRRTYVGGLLDGMQHVYYENGVLFLEYGMSKGDYEGPHATYYDDGKVKASGTMKGGFVSGDWTYDLRINDTLKNYMDEHAASFSFPASAWQDGVISYHVLYTEDTSQSGCMLDRCIQWTYSDVE